VRVALIPARGGSKRIPKKNIVPFAGKPMISHAIELVQSTKLFDRIIVSTDNEEIAALARQYGAETPFMRPEKESDDFATMTDVLLHFTEWLDKEKLAVNEILCVFPATPLLQKEDIITGLNRMKELKASGAFTVCPFPSKIQRALKINNEGSLSFINSEFEFTRTQDLEESFFDAGQFYWINKNDFQKEKKLVMAKSAPVIIEQLRAIDIDTPEDLLVAETLYKAFK